jgi:hypothetical protein
VLGKLWSGTVSHGEPTVLVNLEETKSTQTRIMRHSVS